MANRLKRSILIAFTALFSAIALSAPVFAEPTTTTAPSTTTSPTTGGTQPSTTTETTTTTTTAEGEGNTTAEGETPTVTDFSEEDRETCYTEAGAVAWLVCPGAGFLSGIIDGAFGALQKLITIKPISADNSSPFYVVWQYFRNLTNILFTIVLIIVIISQVTGLGISNYGIKKAAPRLIVSAFCANISFQICQIALDLSTILGTGIYNLFQDLLAAALANGAANNLIQSVSIADLTMSILGIGVVGATGIGIALAANGGVMGLMVMLLPVIFGGVLAVISAIITMAARQALVYLLVMVSPLAFVAYTLPNTNRWWQKWYNLFFSMLIFYPSFSLLYGASQLAGTAIIASATDWLTVILGIAVRVLPLIMTFPMLRMSGTMLGRIDGLVHRAASPADRALRRYAGERREYERQRMLFNPNPVAPHARLAQYMNRRAETRRYRTMQYAANNKDSAVANAIEEGYRGGRANEQFLADSYLMEARKMRNSIVRLQNQTDLDEGLDESRFRSARAQSQVRGTSAMFDNLVIDDHMAKARARSVTAANTELKAARIQDNIDDETSQIHQQFLDTFRYSDANSEQAQHGLKTALSSAISARKALDKTATAEYETLFDALPAGAGPSQQLVLAAQNKDANMMEAALHTIAKRGDYDLIAEKLQQVSASFDGEENIEMQKRLSDTLITMKKDNPELGLYAKSLMMRRAIAANGGAIKNFVSFEEFLNSRISTDAEGNEILTGPDADIVNEHINDTAGWHPEITDMGQRKSKALEDFKKVGIVELFNAEKDAGALLGADRTFWKSSAVYSYGKKNNPPLVSPVIKNGVEVSPLAMRVKDLRSALCQGLDGEVLDNMLDNAFGCFRADSKDIQSHLNITSGDGNWDANVLFGQQGDIKSAYTSTAEHQDIIYKQVKEIFSEMSGSQIAKQKSGAIDRLNSFLLAYNEAKASREGRDIDEDKIISANGKTVISKELIEILNSKHQLDELCKPNQTARRAEMNTGIVELLGLQEGHLKATSAYSRPGRP